MTRRWRRSRRPRPPTRTRPSRCCSRRARCGPSGRDADARRALEQALAIDATNAEAKRGLAELALARGASDEAAALLEPIVLADPTDVPALVKLGVARMRGGRSAEALALFERAVALDPGNAEARLDLAGALGKSGRSADAIPHFEKALEAGGRTTAALNGLGVARLETGDPSGAARAFRESLALDPSQAGIADLLRRVAGGRAVTRKRRRRLPLGLGLLAVVALGAAAVFWLRQPAPAPAAPRGGLSVLLVTLDTTRADRLGCYGHAAAKTRYLDRLAAEGTRFETVIAPAPITLPSHSSILTGLYPFEHGVRNNGNFYLDARHPTLASVLKARGYRTGAFVSSFILDRRYGLDRGFDVYDDRMEGEYSQVLTLQAERRGDRTALALGRFIDERAKEPQTPFFAWLHLYDPHEPYRPPHPFRDMFAHDLYDGELAFVDAILASVLDRLRGAGLLDRTLVVVTADHGESLGEHGETTHSMFVYEGAIRVPLLLWRPGLVPAGQVVREPVRLVDVSPTILELLGERPLATPHARSLVPLVEGRSTGAAPPAYSETLLPKFYMNWAPLRALRDGRYKLIDAPRPELYDLQADPGRVDEPLLRAHADRRGAPPRPGAARDRRRRDEPADARPRGDGEAGGARLHRRRSGAADGRADEPGRPEGLHRALRPPAPGQQRRARAAFRRGDPDPEDGARRRPEERVRHADPGQRIHGPGREAAKRSFSSAAISSSCPRAPTPTSGSRSARCGSATAKRRCAKPRRRSRSTRSSRTRAC